MMNSRFVLTVDLIRYNKRFMNSLMYQIYCHSKHFKPLNQVWYTLTFKLYQQGHVCVHVCVVLLNMNLYVCFGLCEWKKKKSLRCLRSLKWLNITTSSLTCFASVSTFALPSFRSLRSLLRKILSLLSRQSSLPHTEIFDSPLLQGF